MDWLNLWNGLGIKYVVGNRWKGIAGRQGPAYEQDLWNRVSSVKESICKGAISFRISPSCVARRGLAWSAGVPGHSASTSGLEGSTADIEVGCLAFLNERSVNTARPYPEVFAGRRPLCRARALWPLANNQFILCLAWQGAGHPVGPRWLHQRRRLPGMGTTGVGARGAMPFVHSPYCRAGALGAGPWHCWPIPRRVSCSDRNNP